MYDQTRDVAVLARSYVEKGWTQRVEARDVDGLNVDPRVESAVAWCLVGSLRRARHDLEADERAFQQAKMLFAALLGTDPAIWNDDLRRTKEEVVDEFGVVIAVIDQASEVPDEVMEAVR